MQWLKLNYHDARLPKLVDKIAVRDFVASTIGSEYLIPLIALYESPDSIDFSLLPNSFVLKTNHDSGGVFICTDKSKFDSSAAKRILKHSFDTNFYYSGREWPYKILVPKILCEEYLTDESGYELKDYKFFCFHGKAKIIQVDFNRFSNHTRNPYDTNWNFLPYEIEYRSDPLTTIPRPKVLDTMITLAEKLACDFPHVRVDLYTFHENIYFGKLTFYHGSGWERFHPESFGLLLGSYINLPKSPSRERD
nr:ATP-grasp fold amidoligase family protein [uncultured Sphaerochaeta sp.]